jgi:hypothetical protein
MRARRNSAHAGETKRNEAKPKQNQRFRFAPRNASFGGAHEISDFTNPCGFKSLRGVSFRRTTRIALSPRGGKVPGGS